MIIYYYHLPRISVTRHILSHNIKFVSVCDNLDRGTKEYGIGIKIMDRGMNTEIVQDHNSNQKMRDKGGNIQ